MSNTLITYGLYFVVAFSVLAFGAAEDGKEQRSEVGSQKSEDGGQSDHRPNCPQISQINADLLN
jgi:hypothetical protein